MISTLLSLVLLCCVVTTASAAADAGDAAADAGDAAAVGNDATSSSSSNADDTNNSLNLHVIEMPGVTLYKMPHPIDVGPVDDDFPGILPVEFIYQAWNINVTTTNGGKQMIDYYKNKRRRRQSVRHDNDEQQCETTDDIDDDSVSTTTKEEEIEDDDKVLFGFGLVERAKEMFQQRNLLHELEYFFETGVSNPNAGPRRMHWVGIDIHPNKSLALHSHPNIEFAYIVQGTMYEYRLMDPNYTKKTIYDVPQQPGEEANFKYIGPNLTHIDAAATSTATTTTTTTPSSSPSSFQLNSYNEGEMFINTIGDVHQSFTKDDGMGVKLFVLWGNGNADVPNDQYPQNSHKVLNIQSAQAWT